MSDLRVEPIEGIRPVQDQLWQELQNRSMQSFGATLDKIHTTHKNTQQRLAESTEDDSLQHSDISSF